MEFHEKLQALRKSKDLTQEELAEALFVSRTAVSKWESGRGWPSIDSLQAIAKYFGVTVDELLSAEAVLSLAKQEKASGLQDLCGMLFGAADLAAVLLMLLPLYPKPIDGYVYAVNLFACTDIAAPIRMACGVIFAALAGLGVLKICLTRAKSEKSQKTAACHSMLLGIAAVLLLASIRAAYAVVAAFALLAAKAFLLYKQN